MRSLVDFKLDDRTVFINRLLVADNWQMCL